MNSVKIIVKGGEGREVNPYNPYSPRTAPNSEYSEFDQFSKDHHPYPAPGIADGTHMARLQWQAHDPGEDWVDVPDGNRGYYAIRQIWVLSPDGETNLKIENMKTTELRTELAKIRKEATDIILSAMGTHNDLHFPIMQVSLLHSLVSNPRSINHTTKGNLELWSTESLINLATFIEGPDYYPQKGEIVEYLHHGKKYNGEVIHVDLQADVYQVGFNSSKATSIYLSRFQLKKV